jgi:hypothetical protein
VALPPSHTAAEAAVAKKTADKMMIQAINDALQ